MKFIYNTLAVLFCIITLGFIDLRIEYSDATEFNWIGWISRMMRKSKK